MFAAAAPRAHAAAAGVFWLEFQQEVAGRCGVRARGARTPPFYCITVAMRGRENFSYGVIVA